jgi:hypothetical protein
MLRPFCPKCETGRTGDFCSQCGIACVEGVRSCVCGYTNIWPHEKFCQQCGKAAPPLPSLPFVDRVCDVVDKAEAMTRIYIGKITGNNIRREYGDYKEGTSVVEFEIDGFFPIGSAVHIEMTIMEERA